MGLRTRYQSCIAAGWGGNRDGGDGGIYECKFPARVTGDEGWGVTTKWEQTTYIIMSGLSAPQHSFLSFEVIMSFL